MTDGRCDEEIRKRIGIAKSAFSELSNILKNKHITMPTRIHVLKSYVWPILLYGCETWTVSKIMREKLAATEMWFLRRMMRISWKDMMKNNAVLIKARTQKSLLATIITRQMDFFGHVMRKEGIKKLVTTGMIEGKRDRGRQRRKYLDSLCYLQGGQYGTIDVIRATEDRWKWTSMIADAVNLHGT